MKILLLFSFLVAFLSKNLQAQDSAKVTLEVTVPEETPHDATIFWAGSLNNWDPGDEGGGFSPKELAEPLKKENGKWQVTLASALGDTVHYKYTRGSIFSVEEKADYTYRNPRTVIFDTDKAIQDTVAAWHDIPPASIAEQWPKIELTKTDSLIITYNHTKLEGMGGILYAEDLISRFWGKDLYKKINSVPPELKDTVAYFQKVSDAPDNTILVLAGKKDSVWNIYADQNNDERITEDEFAFVIDGKTKAPQWKGLVYFDRLSDGVVIQDSSQMLLKQLNNLPAGYSSSSKAGVPNLSATLPFKNRTGTLTAGEGNSIFYISTFRENNFKKYFQLLADRDGNDTLEIASASPEVTAYGSIGRSRKYYPFPIFELGKSHWKVANIDIEGRWIRLRPATATKEREPIAEGEPAPTWNSIATNRKHISSESLSGKYVLLDFWGSWCGPCIEELPLLKKTYEKFKSQNFEMVSFAYENRPSLEEALQKYQLPWPQILDDEGVFATKFLVRGYPAHYLVGPNGTILEMGETLRGAKLTETLEKYLK